MIDVTEAHLCQERRAEVSEDTPLSEDTGNDPRSTTESRVCGFEPHRRHCDVRGRTSLGV